MLVLKVSIILYTESFLTLTHRAFHSSTGVLCLSLEVNLRCIFNNPLDRHLYELIK